MENTAVRVEPWQGCGAHANGMLPTGRTQALEPDLGSQVMTGDLSLVM